ncbi:hypothetical protein [Carboxydocella sp. ULO1]|uniref:hypothetical protein n=1 Tax=Carboxydocella sp. ULO1 TaxID=1926599 RepID=UPI0009AD782E|nr:hypothetical protein [Carboxydocella sp. ULO1]GAW28561.1 hypothetical protein ULO1_11310 [Carboxydocella sp. ULO1]
MKDVKVLLIEQIRMANQKELLADIVAKWRNDSWPVRIERMGDGFIVSGRGSRLDVFLTKTNRGYLVSVPNFARCGIVRPDCSTFDIMEYVEIDNPVDATTLATAVRYLIKYII